jgi:hypothetical protein
MPPFTESIEQIQSLLALYRASHYDVRLPNGDVATIRVGELAPAPITHWIDNDGPAFYMTACNPHSQSLSTMENEQRLESLRAHLRERGASYLEGDGHIPGESWREPSLLVRGIADIEIADLVRRYEQNGIIVVSTARPAVMRIYRADWRIAGDAADIEWA